MPPEQCADGEPREEFNILEGVGDEVGVFDDLTMKEMQNVIDYMVSQSGLNIIMDQPMPVDNSIFLIEVLPPPKAETLAFLDNDRPRPQRFAKVILFR